MLQVFRDAGFEVARELEGGEIEVRFPIAATETFRARVDERDHAAVTASLRPFFAPGSVAVVGASRGAARSAASSSATCSRPTSRAPPTRSTGTARRLGACAATRSSTSCPRFRDLAVVCLPGRFVIESVQEALELGIKAVCVISSGFAEVGGEGVQRQAELLDLVRAHGARLVGPNCLGIAIPPLGLNATFGPRPLPPGPIAFSSQSGALGLALLEKASERRLGFSSFVSIGNKADVSSNDLLEWWEEDAATEVVLLYLESFGNPAQVQPRSRGASRGASRSSR